MVEVHISHFCILKYCGYFKEAPIGLFEVHADLASFFHGPLFLLERMTNYSYSDLYVWQTFSQK